MAIILPFNVEHTQLPHNLSFSLFPLISAAEK